MRLISYPAFILFFASVCLLVHPVDGQLHPTRPAQYQSLPPLREQSDILNNWRLERLNHLPYLLQKYGVDAWLVRIPIH